ncbi:MAG TPA: NADH-quinone oxidoreductase subunit C [Zoogloea sp.]|uniref:NADH-quinone oxidoreductase subunit C n=1 Tax=Zoogloea sp. TaxID=49181 RepID=UPI002BA400D1|nr:NADH-quinone oxidoreductase subunit C [Zoogloea sp.]HMV61709.1 NADH-quinone oxidoreductase subunit C [Rhodocyclaceae bacterium]HNI66422.1 NADH-quinone oxidoreductase subunit C [Nitrospira sp.]HMW50457.1 NADH-quinone oxidoreductase subunit C [Rhodocyclaceae bacterium]HMZ74597.1 NADH-quinone oxidoreductase subunit C [Rhodocyclaceae bacterium]HNB62996.1 NADH-quinone oxidoreductase subunit C [Rhodocyclaceae bacterium]
MSSKLENLTRCLSEKFADDIVRLIDAAGEVTLEVRSENYLAVAESLRDDPELAFEQLVDLTGVDYSVHALADSFSGRFAVVSHLLSIRHNVRLRLRTFAEDSDFPMVASLCAVWPSANWFEREAFDLFGVMFMGHPDLRRILTDYGFVGHPFRKDFPVSGFVEMRYDQDLGRVIYQPVSIEPRENTPRIVREDSYGDVGHG